MFCKIDDKYYVKVTNFLHELEVVDGNIVPTKGDKKRIYSPFPKFTVVTSEEILKAEKKKKKKFDKKNEDIF